MRNPRWQGRRVGSIPLIRIALRQTPTPAELRPILPIIPASVTILIVGLFACSIVRRIRFCFCSSCQSQFCARKLALSVFQDKAVHPSENSPNAISVRTLHATISERSTLAPSATPAGCQYARIDLTHVVTNLSFLRDNPAISPVSLVHKFLRSLELGTSPS